VDRFFPHHDEQLSKRNLKWLNKNQPDFNETFSSRLKNLPSAIIIVLSAPTFQSDDFSDAHQIHPVLNMFFSIEILNGSTFQRSAKKGSRDFYNRSFAFVSHDLPQETLGI